MKNLSSLSTQMPQMKVVAENTAKSEAGSNANGIAGSKTFQAALNDQIQNRKNQSKPIHAQHEPQTRQAVAPTNGNQSAGNEPVDVKEKTKIDDSTNLNAQVAELQISLVPEQTIDVSSNSQALQDANVSTLNASMVAAMINSPAKSSTIQDLPALDDQMHRLPSDAFGHPTEVDVLSAELAKGGGATSQGLDTALSKALNASPAVRNNDKTTLPDPLTLSEAHKTEHARWLDAVLPDVNKDSVGLSRAAGLVSESAVSTAKDKLVNDILAPTNLQLQAQTNVMPGVQQAVSSNTIAPYFGKTGWDQAISQKVVWMVGAGEQSATLTLNPPDLGPLQVVIHVHNDQADTTFISDNAEVRQALEDGISNLRSKMSESGVQLGQTNVSTSGQSQNSFQQQAQNSSRPLRGDGDFDANTDTENVRTQRLMRTTNGLVDTFA